MAVAPTLFGEVSHLVCIDKIGESYDFGIVFVGFRFLRVQHIDNLRRFLFGRRQGTRT